ncbi:cell division protein FtsX [Thermodesulforhabdus norvegica]|uniref:Cell division protein FtsX n=1 Tax=Thermodesulforhabdus norvegica TaxID=39841 RepID=A0A1I4TZ39_9BACT|nr:permease-like cell division protein FtsX [Thermodesulforhabdus norvegica]SFM81840.1 Cell division protein FtsX [Thermodesulforhabdus norvegica]
MQARFVLLWVLREVKASWPYFLATVLCVGWAVFLGSVALQGREIWRCITPSWASQTTTIVLMKPGVEDGVIDKIRQSLEASPWVESFEVFQGEKALLDFRARNPDLAHIVEDLDPAYIPVYFRIITAEKCLADFVRCEEFLKSLGSMEVVDRLYSGFLLAGRVFRWFDHAGKVLLFFAVIFLILGLLIAVLLIRLTCEARSRELYLWETLGASPQMIKIPFLIYSSFAIFLGIVTAWVIFGFAGFFVPSGEGSCLPAKLSKCSGLLLPGLLVWALTLVVVDVTLRSMRRKRKWDAR